tara:strand:- start:312 stop:596 length:285 start_codon:yes stop_codon:yes gene_type:complete
MHIVYIGHAYKALYIVIIAAIMNPSRQQTLTKRKDTDMETLTTQTQLAMNMVDYWKDMRVGECELRNPAVCKLIDKNIAKYEAQVDHLRELAFA